MLPKLNDIVIIGFCDVSAAGCRACLGCSKEAQTLDLQTNKIDLESVKSQINDEDGEVPLFSRVDCDNEKVTLISISSNLSSGAASHLFNEILDQIRNSQTKEITIIASIAIKVNSVKDSDVFQIAVNCDKVNAVKLLPDGFIIKDFMLNMMIQLCQVENIPLRCIVTQGYKIGSGTPNDKDGSLQSITNLQGTLHSLYGLRFDAEKTNSLGYKANVTKVQPQNSMFL